MPQVKLQQGHFDVQIQVASEAPADIYALADRLLELAGALVGEILEAQLTGRLREELGPRGQTGNQFTEESDPECPDWGENPRYWK